MHTGASPVAEEAVALGILAGGRGRRLGGVDKAWLRRNGRTQVERLLECFGRQCRQWLVSANRDIGRYQSLAVRVVTDRLVDHGPLGGIEALAAACACPWLLTMPVDLVEPDDRLLPALRALGAHGAAVEDADGPQPLVALWPLKALRAALPGWIVGGDLSVKRLQRRLGMATLQLPAIRFGNLNTAADLALAGVELE